MPVSPSITPLDPTTIRNVITLVVPPNAIKLAPAPDGLSARDYIGWAMNLIIFISGFITSQLAVRWQAANQQRRYKESIYAELMDVRSTLLTRLEILRVGLRQFSNNESTDVLPATVGCPIFDRFYSECAAMFSESERLSLTHNYGRVAKYNSDLAIAETFAHYHTIDGSIIAEKHFAFIERITDLFINVHVTCALIGLQLSQKGLFDIRSPANTATANNAEQAALAELQTLLGAKGRTSAFEKLLSRRT